MKASYILFIALISTCLSCGKRDNEPKTASGLPEGTIVIGLDTLHPPHVGSKESTIFANQTLGNTVGSLTARFIGNSLPSSKGIFQLYNSYPKENKQIYLQVNNNVDFYYSYSKSPQFLIISFKNGKLNLDMPQTWMLDANRLDSILVSANLTLD